MQIDFATDPARYRHWRLDIDGPVAILTLDVDPAGGLFPGTELKLNSYDLGVDIELADAVTRLRFEHPEVRAVVIRSGKPNVFCAGANIGALAHASHAHKVRSAGGDSPLDTELATSIGLDEESVARLMADVGFARKGDSWRWRGRRTGRQDSRKPGSNAFAELAKLKKT